MATQWGIECWCATGVEVEIDYERHGDEGDGAVCDYQCPGNPVRFTWALLAAYAPRRVAVSRRPPPLVVVVCLEACVQAKRRLTAQTCRSQWQERWLLANGLEPMFSLFLRLEKLVLCVLASHLACACGSKSFLRVHNVPLAPTALSPMLVLAQIYMFSCYHHSMAVMPLRLSRLCHPRLPSSLSLFPLCAQSRVRRTRRAAVGTPSTCTASDRTTGTTTLAGEGSPQLYGIEHACSRVS